MQLQVEICYPGDSGTESFPTELVNHRSSQRSSEHSEVGESPGAGVVRETFLKKWMATGSGRLGVFGWGKVWVLEEFLGFVSYLMVLAQGTKSHDSCLDATLFLLMRFLIEIYAQGKVTNGN